MLQQRDVGFLWEKRHREVHLDLCDATETDGTANSYNCNSASRYRQAYPEFARQLLDQAEPEFEVAIGEWDKKYGRVGQRKYVVMFLWMAYTGLGLVPRKVIVNAAKRLRVTHDITAEAERFELERQDALSVYSYVDRPKGKTADQISVAVDALCRLSIGIKDGQPISKADQEMLVPIVSQAFKDADPTGQLTKDAVTDAARNERQTYNA